MSVQFILLDIFHLTERGLRRSLSEDQSIYIEEFLDKLNNEVYSYSSHIIHAVPLYTRLVTLIRIQ